MIGIIPDQTGWVAIEPTFFNTVNGRAPAPVSLVVPAPEFTLVIAGDAVVHTEAVGVGGEITVLVEVQHIALVLHSGKVSAPPAIVLVFSAGGVEGGPIMGCGSQGDVKSSLPIWANGISFMVVSTDPKVGT